MASDKGELVNIEITGEDETEASFHEEGPDLSTPRPNPCEGLTTFVQCGAAPR